MKSKTLKYLKWSPISTFFLVLIIWLSMRNWLDKDWVSGVGLVLVAMNAFYKIMVHGQTKEVNTELRNELDELKRSNVWTDIKKVILQDGTK